MRRLNMALKQCEYCRSFTDSKNTRCPHCSAPLNNKIIPEEGNSKETVALKVTETINKVIPNSAPSAQTVPSSPYENDYNRPKKASDVQTLTKTDKRMLNKWIVLILALVGGWLGVHRFYEGKIFTGILYVITFGFFGLGTFIDILLILGKPTTYPAKR